MFPGPLVTNIVIYCSGFPNKLSFVLFDQNSCDAKRAKKAVLSVLPVIGWMRDYRVKEWLLGDVVSGISTGLVAIMQGEQTGDILCSFQAKPLQSHYRKTFFFMNQKIYSLFLTNLVQKLKLIFYRNIAQRLIVFKALILIFFKYI